MSIGSESTRASGSTRTSGTTRTSSRKSYDVASGMSRASSRKSYDIADLINQKMHMSKKLTAEDFKGLIAPVLAFFNEDESNSLNVDYIDKYAAWLRQEQIHGICVNTITGEGPALGLTERRIQLEAWWSVAYKYDLLTIVQIGGAPLADVLELATHAEKLGVHAVLCLPEFFFKPKTIEELVGYCRIVANECSTRPFLYYHIPSLTGVNLDMCSFCDLAEKSIPNFIGILYSSTDLEIGANCLREGRVVMLGASLVFASGILLGFNTFMGSFLTVRPDLGRGIVAAMNTNDIKLASTRQQQLNDIIRYNLSRSETHQWVDTIKYWFNQENQFQRGPRLQAGPIRNFYLRQSITQN